MSQVSPQIKPIRPMPTNKEGTLVKTWAFEDNSTRIFPKVNGKTIPVTIIKRVLTGSSGIKLYSCKNAGKWSFRIHYPFQLTATRMNLAKFVKEANRMECGEYLAMLIAAK